MEDIQEQYGFVISSKRRARILASLNKKPLRPFEIAKRTGYKPSNVSVALFQLQKREFVKCLTPGKASWRVYGITETGKRVLELFKN